MVVFMAIRHSTAYYDDYEEEKIIGIYKKEKKAIEKILIDIYSYSADRIKTNIAMEYLFDDGNNIFEQWEIVPTKIE